MRLAWYPMRSLRRQLTLVDLESVNKPLMCNRQLPEFVRNPSIGWNSQLRPNL